MSRTIKFLYNSSSTAILQIVTMIAGFITPRYMLQFYGSEINGLVSSIAQFISYFNIVESGLSGAAVYELYKPLAENNYSLINAIVTAAKKLYTQAGYIFISLTLGLSIIYPIIVKTKSLNFFSVALLVLILGVNGSLEFFSLAKYRAILTADQKTYIISIASIVNIILQTLIIAILASLKVNIVILRFIALTSIFIRSLILTIYVKMNYKYLNFKVPSDNIRLEKRWDVMYLQIMGVIRAGIPIVILTMILRNLKLVSVYTVYNMIIGGISGILSIFLSGLTASFGDVIARKQIKVLQQAYDMFEFSYYSVITVIYGVTFVTIMPFISIYTSGITDVNYYIPTTGFLFVFNALMYNIHTPQAMLVQSAGMYKETRLQTTIQGLLVVIFSGILGTIYGINGILFGSIISNIYRNIDLFFYTPNKIIKTSVKKSIYRAFRILSCIFFIYLPYWNKNIEFTSYIYWFLFVIKVSFYAAVIVMLNGILFDKNSLKNCITRMLFLTKLKKNLI